MTCQDRAKSDAIISTRMLFLIVFISYFSTSIVDPIIRGAHQDAIRDKHHVADHKRDLECRLLVESKPLAEIARTTAEYLADMARLY